MDQSRGASISGSLVAALALLFGSVATVGTAWADPGADPTRETPAHYDHDDEDHDDGNDHHPEGHDHDDDDHDGLDLSELLEDLGDVLFEVGDLISDLL